MPIRVMLSLIVFFSFCQFAQSQTISKDGSRYKYHETIYSSYEIGEILTTDTDAGTKYESFRSKLKGSQGILLVGGGLTVGSIGYIYFFEERSNSLSDIPSSWLLLGVALIIDMIGLGTSASAYSDLNKSIKIFNKNHSPSTNLGYTHISIGLTKTGVGISYNF